MVNIKQIANNLTAVKVKNAVFYFSYETLIAVNIDGLLIASENVWSKTTNKHLTMISKSNERIPNDQFNSLVSRLEVVVIDTNNSEKNNYQNFESRS